MKPYLYGLGGTIGLLSLYAVTMTILSGWGAAVEQFSALWYLMVPLAASFGIQVGLYTKAREGVFSIYESERKQNFRRSLPSLALSLPLDGKTIASSDRKNFVSLSEIRHADQSAGGAGSLAAGGASAGASMLACCAHHATDVLPFLGLSALSIFLTRYQIPILLGSLAINIIGIAHFIKLRGRVILSN